MVYTFQCKKNHSQELQLNSSEFENLPREDGKKYIDCNIVYGDSENPNCNEKAYQTFWPVRFSGVETRARL